MNLNANPTPEQLRDLIAGADDWAGHHVLWVKDNGDVVLTTIPKGQPPNAFRAGPDLRICCETFLGGNEYVGPEAASDSEWVSQLFETLLDRWQRCVGKADIVYVPISDALNEI